MSLGAVAFLGLTIATFCFVGAMIFYAQRQTEIVMKARLAEGGRPSPGIGRESETSAGIGSTQIAA